VKVKINPRFLFKLFPAVIAAVEETVDAVHPDSEGGKKITKDELEDIVEAAASKFRDVLAGELASRFSVED